MQPVFRRAVFEVTAGSSSEARSKALTKIRKFSERDWVHEGESDKQPPLVEELTPADEFDNDEDAYDFMWQDRMEYALLQADIGTGEGDMIAPLWLGKCSDVLVADLT